MNLRKLLREPALPVGMFGIAAAILGFVREQVIAAQLGLSTATDAYYLALSVCVFLPGIVNAASSGILAAHHAKAVRERGEAYGKTQLGRILLVCGGLSLTAIAFLGVAGGIAYPFLAASRNVEKLHLMLQLAACLALAIPALSVTTAAVGALNVQGKYILGGASTIVAPITASLVLLVAPASPWSAAGGLVLGLNLQAALLLAGLRRLGVSPWQKIHWAYLAKTLKDMGHLAMGAVVANSTALVIQAVVASHGARSTSTYSFGIKITAAYLGLSVMFFSTLLNPIFAARANGLPYSQKRLRAYLWLAGTSTMAATAILTFGSADIIRLVLKRGAFSESDVAAVAGVHAFAALQIPTYLFSALCARLVAAYHDTRFLGRMSWLQAAIAMSLLWPLHQALGIRGLVLANAVAFAVIGACLFWRHQQLKTEAQAPSTHPTVGGA